MDEMLVINFVQEHWACLSTVFNSHGPPSSAKGSDDNIFPENNKEMGDKKKT